MTAIVKCITYTGNVVAALPTSGFSGASGGDASSATHATAVNFNGLEKITGGIEVRDWSALDDLSSDSLREADSITIKSPFLQKFRMPHLQYTRLLEFTGTEVFQPELNGSLKVSQLVIRGGFSGSFIYPAQKVENFTLAANGPAKFIVKMKKAGSINLADHDYHKTSDVFFPDLTAASSVNCTYCFDASFPLLQTVDGPILLQHSRMSAAFPNLTHVGDEITIRDSAIDTLAFPLLERAGGLKISNLTGVKEITDTSFPYLRSIDGEISVAGNFDKVELSNLTSVNAVSLQSTSDNMNCSTFDSLHRSNKIKGPYTCTGTHPAQQRGLSQGVKAGIGTRSAIAVITLLLATTIFYRMRRRKAVEPAKQDEDGFRKPEIDGNGKTYAEMCGDGKVFEVGERGMIAAEMSSGKHAHELPGVLVLEGVHEMPEGHGSSVYYYDLPSQSSISHSVSGSVPDAAPEGVDGSCSGVGTPSGLQRDVRQYTGRVGIPMDQTYTIQGFG
ncbi:hypothetical protein DM02DRAFT_676950 [Periconia macrospinosa]|uniref:Uncharacterized protein n=1 Tax=Periconia macrospinosa TaxID=97972 RepID=A0A2V1D7Z6_9PLEO|nr:hypothetical protein DM02DRAFT_676950 [Periconia macrospinosa]